MVIQVEKQDADAQWLWGWICDFQTMAESVRGAEGVSCGGGCGQDESVNLSRLEHDGCCEVPRSTGASRDQTARVSMLAYPRQSALDA